MKYKDKLEHLRSLVEEAKRLANRFGFFYITHAMFVYLPDNDIKLSLWVHPNLLEEKCIHPIVKQTPKQEE